MFLTLCYACMSLILPNISGIITQAKNHHIKALSIRSQISYHFFYFFGVFTVLINSNLKAMKNYTRRLFYSRPKQSYRLGYNRFVSGSKVTESPSDSGTKSTGVAQKPDLELSTFQTWTPDPAGVQIFSQVSLKPNIRGGFLLCKCPVRDSFKLHQQITT